MVVFILKFVLLAPAFCLLGIAGYMFGKAIADNMKNNTQRHD
jgi:hypothetical protein